MTNIPSPTPNHAKKIREAIQSIQNIMTRHHDSTIQILDNNLMVLSNFFRNEPLQSIIIPTLRKIHEQDFKTWEHRYYEDGTPITAELFGMLEPSRAATYDEFTGKVTEPPILIQELLLLSVYDIQKTALFEVLALLSTKK